QNAAIGNHAIGGIACSPTTNDPTLRRPNEDAESPKPTAVPAASATPKDTIRRRTVLPAAVGIVPSGTRRQNAVHAVAGDGSVEADPPPVVVTPHHARPW